MRDTGLYLMNTSRFDDLFPAAVRHDIAAQIDIADRPCALPSPGMEKAKFLFTSWGAPKLDEQILDLLPNLEVVFHAAGSVRELVTPELWRRNIRVVSAVQANAEPVVEFTISQVVLSLKNFWRLSLATRNRGEASPQKGVLGVDNAIVGLVGLGEVGRRVAAELQRFKINVLGYDPMCTEATAGALGVTLVDLDQLFSVSDVLSIHAPLLESTRGMVNGRLMGLLKADATIINTSRGAIIDTGEMANLLEARPDVFALLDVTDPEPLPAGHPLLALDNVLITPHVAGSLGSELGRLGELVAHEFQAYVAGLPLLHEVTEQNAQHAA